MKKFIFVLLFLFLFLNSGFSQVSEEFRIKYDMAQDYLNAGDFLHALPAFLSLDSAMPNSSNIHFCIGICYVNMARQKQKAIPYLERAIQNVSFDYFGRADETTAPIFAYYYLGQAYLIANRIDEAIAYYNKFRACLSEKNKDLIKDVDRQLEISSFAREQIMSPVYIRIEDLNEPVNSKFPEYSPVLSLDEHTLIFTSRRDSSTGGKIDVDGKYFEDIYIATFDENTKKWTNVKSIGANINTVGHEAPISISTDGKKLFIYKDDNGDGNIYISRLINGEWAAPEKLPEEINTKAWETHASLSPDGNTLYFTSNRKGGFGGKDIYKSEKLEGGNWSKAINLGLVINTEYDEESPFILPDGVTLYFSSKGHSNMGGYDIFISTLSEQGEWSEPENIGYPINTTDDDVFYVPTKDQKHAYYSSSKEGGMGDIDIYKLSIIPPKVLMVRLNGTVLDELTHLPLSAKVELFDTRKNEVIADITTDSKTGTYTISLQTNRTYNLNISCEKYTSYHETFSVPDTVSNTEINKVTLLQKKKPVAAKQKKQLAYLYGPVTDEYTGEFLVAKIELTDAKANAVIANAVSDENTGEYYMSLPTNKIFNISAVAENHFPYKDVVNVPDTVSITDIYKPIVLRELKADSPAVAEKQSVNLKGTICDDLTKKPVASKIQIYDVQTGDIIAGFTTDNITGTYYLSLPSGKTINIIVTAAGYITHKENYVIPDTITMRKVNKIIYIKKVQTVAAGTDTIKVLRLRGNVYNKLTQKPLTENVKIELSESPSKRIVANVTPDKETAEFFASISTGKTYRLSVSADKYFPYSETFSVPDVVTTTEIYKAVFLKKILPDSLFASRKPMVRLKGITADYRSNKPLASKIELYDANTNSLFTSYSTDSKTGAYSFIVPAGRKFNLTASAKKHMPYKDTVNIPVVAVNTEITKNILLQKAGPLADTARIMFDNKEIVVGDQIVLNNVWFDFDKYSLRQESTVELDKWLAFLTDNPTLKIEVSGHTDNKGTAKYNILLSENRAKAVRDYFISRGISKTRIKWKGYGLTKPVASNLTDEGRQKNRRTEIKIISK